MGTGSLTRKWLNEMMIAGVVRHTYALCRYLVPAGAVQAAHSV